MVYTVDEEADAGILFETMNNRGKPITDVLMERDVALAKDWTVKDVQQRREHIKQWALKRWRVSLPEKPDPGPVLEAGEITPDDYRRLLQRRGVPLGQAQLYWALYQAGDVGLTSDELVKVMGRRDRKNLGGILGALGNRINHTPGYGQDARPGIGMLFTVEPVSGGAWRYTMRPEMRAALEEMNPWWLHRRHP